MFRPTSPQRSLFGVEHRMEEEKRVRLERSWAHAFRTGALPLIDEEQFRRFFDQDNGRPNKSIRLVLCVLVLKDIHDYTDSEALEQLEWNTAWHYALDITPEQAHSCQKTLHNYRVLLLQDEEGAKLFEETTARLIMAAALRTGRQRHDSTHVVSNIKILTRLGLFVGTLTKFLEALRKEHPRICGRVSDAIRERYLDREGYFSDARSSEAPRRMADAALDIYALVKQFGQHESVSAMPEFALLVRLYQEQCVPPDTETPVSIALVEKPPSSSLQSPSDPDATYGHKGKGYEVQLTETCAKDNPFQAITAVSVNGANESDQNQLAAALDQVARTCGAPPQEMLADSGYASGENIVAAEGRGTSLQAPIGAAPSTEHFPISQFRFNGTRTEVLACPGGQKPAEHRQTKRSLKVYAHFDGAACATCPLVSICPTEKRRRARVLSFTPAEVATSQRRMEQETPDFKENYKARSGIEATNSEAKRSHGARKLRVRGSERVGLSVRLKALAINFKRYVRHLTDLALAADESPMDTCACG